jgi:hypothetical protein
LHHDVFCKYKRKRLRFGNFESFRNAAFLTNQIKFNFFQKERRLESEDKDVLKAIQKAAKTAKKKKDK